MFHVKHFVVMEVYVYVCTYTLIRIGFIRIILYVSSFTL
jgi:hypothetical protein